jgi:hypothetical protein
MELCGAALSELHEQIKAKARLRGGTKNEKGAPLATG